MIKGSIGSVFSWIDKCIRMSEPVHPLPEEFIGMPAEKGVGPPPGMQWYEMYAVLAIIPGCLSFVQHIFWLVNPPGIYISTTELLTHGISDRCQA